MKIYWLFLLLATIICFWNESSARITWNGTRYQRKAYWSQAIIFFAVVIFFCGLRSGIADTGTYIQMFKGYPSSISGMDLKSVNKDKGFFVISVLFKQFISNDFHGWMFLITLISGVALMIGLMRYSEYFGLSCYLLIASTMFTYFVNGMRQFIVVTIFFCATYMILDFDFIAFDNPWICIDFIVSIFPKKCKAMGCQNENSHISFVDCRSLL